MNKETFKQECNRQLVEYFGRLKKHNLDAEMKQRIQGFINAGEFLDVITRAEAIALMNTAHLNVFGMTNEERKARKAQINAIRNDTEDSVFDIPAIERLR